MTTRLTKFAILSLSILSASLISDYAVSYFSSWSGKNYKGVAMGMFVTVIVFYPLFSLLERYIKKASSSYIKSSKKMAGSSFFGLIIGYALAILVLFIMFAIVWYDLNPVRDLKSIF